MGWEITPAQSTFPSFATEWDRLNAEFYGRHPYFDSRFIAPLLEFFGDGTEQLCVHRTSTTVNGSLLLRPLGQGRWKLFLPSQTQVGPVLLRDANLLESLFPALPGYAWTIDLLALDPKYCPDWKALRRPRTVLQHALTMAITLEGGFEDYWQSRPKQLRKNLRRYQRRTEELFGSPSISTIGDVSQIVAAVARYGELESMGWKGEAGTAISSSNLQGRFYQKILRDFAASGQAKVVELHIGGQLAASRLLILNECMWVILKTTYNESQAAVAPGRQLLFAILQQAASEAPSSAVEFYTNATHDQAEWATSLRYLHHHQLCRNEFLAATFDLGRTIRASLTSQNPEAANGTSQKPNPISVSAYQRIHDLPAEAIRLIEDDSCRNVELSANWFSNLQRTIVWDDPGVRCYVAEFDGRPSAILPIRLIRRGRIRQVESLGDGISTFSPILAPECTALDLIPLLKRADQAHRGAHVMRFSPTDPHSPHHAKILTALRSIGWAPRAFSCAGNWYQNVPNGWSEYLKSRDSTLIYAIEHIGGKFKSDGGTLEFVVTGVLIEAAIQAFQDIQARGNNRPEPCLDLLPSLIRRLADNGHLRLGIARIGELPIAAQIWVVANRKAHIVKLARDPAFEQYAPDTLLTAHLMEQVIHRDGVIEVENLADDERLIRFWMNHRRERQGIIAYNPRTALGLALAARHVLAGPAELSASKPSATKTHADPQGLQAQSMGSRSRQRLSALFREYGFQNGMLYLLSRTLEGATKGRARVHKYYIVAQPVLDKPLVDPRRRANIQCEEMVPTTESMSPFPRDAMTIEDRLKQGARCIAAYRKQTFAGYLWFIRNRYREDEVRCRYILASPETSAWDFDVYVAPAHRLSFVFGCLWDEANKLMRNDGISWSMSRISALNPNSLKVHGRLGIVRLGSLIFLGLGRLQLMVGSLAPYIHLSLRDSCPNIRIPEPGGYHSPDGTRPSISRTSA